MRIRKCPAKRAILRLPDIEAGTGSRLLTLTNSAQATRLSCARRITGLCTNIPAMKSCSPIRQTFSRLFPIIRARLRTIITSLLPHAIPSTDLKLILSGGLHTGSCRTGRRFPTGFPASWRQPIRQAKPNSRKTVLPALPHICPSCQSCLPDL